MYECRNKSLFNSCFRLLFLGLQGRVVVKFQNAFQTLIHIIMENSNRHASGPVHSLPSIPLHLFVSLSHSQIHTLFRRHSFKDSLSLSLSLSLSECHFPFYFHLARNHIFSYLKWTGKKGEIVGWGKIVLSGIKFSCEMFQTFFSKFRCKFLFFGSKERW